jgi:choline dehydrogenase-like flavoprotein
VVNQEKLMSTEWSAARRSSLRAFSDCVFPSLLHEPAGQGFWARKASDFGIDQAAAQVLSTLPEPQQSGLFGLLDVLAAQGIESLAPAARETLIHAVAESSPDAKLGVLALVRTVLSLAYALADERGQNPNWQELGYPGPQKHATAQEKRIKPLLIATDCTLDADVCVLGSGAGGSVIAAELQARGLSVLVLEAGGYFNEGDFNQLELWAFQNLYWRGGYNATADGTVAMLAGATLGGGTTVNWQNCVRTPDWVRAEWQREHGLEGLEGASFEQALSSVLTRINANDRCSDLNGPHQRLAQGAEKLGYSFRRCLRNVDPARYDVETAGFQGFGDITGSRQGTLNTYLEDAYRAGARIVTRAKAVRIHARAGRAESVAAEVRAEDGRLHALTVRAKHVVVACGALETPALLLRSGLGGPAVGRYLRLHPTVGISGRYAEDQRAWWGPAQAGLSDQFLRLDQDHGILIECAHHALTVAASAVPWESGRAHKELMADMRHYAGLIAITRDRGHGKITLDEKGEGVAFYPLQTKEDLALIQRGIRELCLLHEAAGAERILGLADGGMQFWNRGDDLERFVREIGGSPGAWIPQQLFSAHQMGSARMGRDARTSVAQPSGELFDVRGVWIGDTSAFPSAVGVNPMVTCMALAARTARFITG